MKAETLTLTNDSEVPPVAGDLRKRAVIVDDEPAVLKLLHRVCEAMGYLVHSTSSPEEFRNLVLTEPDIILMDLVMPGVDGVELFRFLALNLVESPVVLISGSDRRVLESAARLAEFQGLRVLGALTKPFDVAELKEVLTRDRTSQGKNIPRATDPIEPEELADAIESGAIVAYLQPQIDLRTNRVAGCEALVRWVHPERGLIFPDRFISVAEQSGLIEALTDCVSKLALKQGALLARAGFPIRCSINVSAISLTEIDFPDRLLRMIEDAGARPQGVTIEVTESRIFEDSVKTLDVVTRLRMKGIELSIDDFGTGYSTFQQLQRFPFNELKIDRAFVFNCETNRDSESIVRSSIELGQRLAIRTVAEGVESVKIADRLLDWGCDLAQGYCYSKALPFELFLEWLKSREA